MFDVVAAMVFKKHLLTLIEKHTCEQNEKKHKYGFSVASDPPEKNSEFKTWLSTLIQAVLSKFGKISKSHPSHSLQKRLLDEIQRMDLHLGPEIQKCFYSIDNAIFTDISFY